MQLKRSPITLFLGLCAVLFHALAFAEESFPLLTTEELKKLIDEQAERITIIDARSPEEYQEVHIKGAINIPEKQFAETAHQLPADKTRALVFYCNGVKCGKSKKAAQKAKDLGYTAIQVYAEGMPVWEEKGMPIFAGPSYEQKIETTKLAPKELQDRLRVAASEVTVVDVRDPEEYREGHIPGAINIPVTTFASQSEGLDKKKSIVVTCNSGGRSYNAYRKLMKLGYEHIYQTIFQDWKDQGLAIETAVPQ